MMQMGGVVIVYGDTLELASKKKKNKKKQTYLGLKQHSKHIVSALDMVGLGAGRWRR